jgi:integrase
MVVLTAYGAGLRVSEAVRLRPEDVDGKRGVIHVKLGKGKKDRYVMRPARLSVEGCLASGFGKWRGASAAARWRARHSAALLAGTSARAGSAQVKAVAITCATW